MDNTIKEAPHDIDLEYRVLAMAIHWGDTAKVISRLNKWDFTNKELRMIFDYIRGYVNDGQSIIWDSIAGRLNKDGIDKDTIEYLNDKFNLEQTSNLDGAIQKLKEYSTRRKLLTDIQSEKPLSEIKEYLDSKVASANKDFNEVEPVNWDRLAAAPQGRRGFLPKFVDFEDTYHGINGLSILTGESEAGKSLFALALAKDFIEQNTPCIYYSLEMDRDSIEKRFMTMILKNYDEKEIWNNTTKLIEKHKKDLEHFGQFLFVRDSINLDNIIAEIDVVRSVTGLNQIFVIVDFLQLIYNVRGNSQKEQLDYVLNHLRAIHNETSTIGKVAILTLTQITKETSKSLEYNKNENDLRKVLFTGGMGSAQIHFAADLYFAILKKESTFQTKLICLKNRHGGNKFKEITLDFKPRGLRYEEN